MNSCSPLKFMNVNLTSSCEYVRTVQSCAMDSGFMKYFEWQYCGFNNQIAPSILMLIWFVLLLIGIATAADSFLSTCLVVVAKTLKMSQNLAGVTLLAFGNGAADVFSSLSAVTSSSTPNDSLAFGAILGAGIIVNAIVAGTIIIIVPFTVMKRPVIKDLLFYFVGLLWVMFIFIRKQIELWSALVFLIMYVIYIIVTVSSRFIYLKKKKLKIESNPKDQVKITILNSEGEVVDLPREDIRKISSFLKYNDPSDLTKTNGSSKILERYFTRNKINIENLEIKPEENHNQSNYQNDDRHNNLTKEDANRDSKKRPYEYDNPVYVSENNNKEGCHYVPKISFINTPKSSITTNNNKYKHESLSNKSGYSGILLNVPVIKRLNESFRYSQSSYTSSIDGKQPTVFRRGIRNSLRRSTSHRSIGSFAKIIIENEQEKELKNLNSNVKLPNSGRSVSLGNIPNNQYKRTIRYYSFSEDTNSSKDDQNIYEGNKRLRDINLNIQSNEQVKEEITELDKRKFPGKWRHLFETIIPISLEDWKEQSKFEKITSIAQIPFMFIFTITIPVVDENALLNGWCKFLNCFHCLICPSLWTILIKVYLTKLGSSEFYLIYVFIIIGAIFSIIVAATSKFDKPPVYQRLFAFMGLITSILWIYEIANEIVNIITVYGVVLSISDAILGLTVLAFANSVGDLVSNVTLARRGYPRIGYTACIGGPIFNLLVGIGLSFTIKTINGPIKITISATIITLNFTILLITLMNLILLPLMKFHPRRVYGIILIVIYILFLLFVILFETKVINIII